VTERGAGAGFDAQPDGGQAGVGGGADGLGVLAGAGSAR